MTPNTSNDDNGNCDGGAFDGIDKITHTSSSDLAWSVMQITRREITKIEDSLDVARDWAEVVYAGFVSGEYSLRKMLRINWVLLRWALELRLELLALRSADRANVKAWRRAVSGEMPAA